MQWYRIVQGEGARGPWKVKMTAYFYSLHTNGLEALVSQWHRDGRSPIRAPHLHLMQAPNVAGQDGIQPHLGRVHLATWGSRLFIGDRMLAHPVRLDLGNNLLGVRSM